MMTERVLNRGKKSREALALALADLRRGWRNLLFIDLVCKGLGLIVFYPLIIAGARQLIAASGSEAVADQAILSFLLSPLGLVTLLAIGTIHFGLIGLELTALLAGASRVAAGKHVTVREALEFTLRRSPGVVSLAGRVWVRLLAIVAPFLVAIGVIYKTFLTRFDINYYLSERPPIFLMSVALAAALVLILAVVLAPRLTGWAFALPVILFENAGVREAMAFSIQRVREHRWTVRSALLLWLACSLLINAAAYGFVKAFALWVLPPFGENLGLLIPLLGVVLLLWCTAYLLANVVGTIALAALGLRLYEQIRNDSNMRADWANTRTKPGLLTLVSSRAFWPLMAAALVGSVAAGAFLLRGVRLDTQVETIAHRGASAAAPENTMAAFEAAIGEGTDWIELDVQETADGAVVVMHDGDFMKQARNSLKVWDATTQQLVDIDIGSWFRPEFSAERVPTLEEVLVRCKDRSRVVIELKFYGHNQRLEERVADVVERTGMQDRIRVMSLNYDMVRKMKSLRPNWTVGLLTATAVGNLPAMEGDFLAVSSGMATPSRIRAAHAAGKKVYVWTVNDPMTMALMVTRGADALITDRPALARSLLQRLDHATTGQRLLLALAFRFGIEPKTTDTTGDIN